MLDKKTMVPCVDYFRCILPITNVLDFVNSLGKIDSRLSIDFFCFRGFSHLNYSNCWAHLEIPSIKFAFNPKNDITDRACLEASDTHNNSGVIFELTGDGIRYIGPDNLKKVFSLCHSLDCKVTRIDYALDFFDSNNFIIPIIQEGLSSFLNPGAKDITFCGKMARTISNFKRYPNDYPDGHTTWNYTIGNHGSDHGMIRVYDKLFETLYGRNKDKASELLKGHEDYWYRCELELHNGKNRDWANESFYNLVKSNYSLYSIIGHTFDMWFSFKLKKFACKANGEYEDYSPWNQFINELVETIHFVELVHQKFIDNSAEKAWKQIEHYSVFLAHLLDFGSNNDANKLRTILDEARTKRNTVPKYILKYMNLHQ
jgi:hypothetical protein